MKVGGSAGRRRREPNKDHPPQTSGLASDCRLGVDLTLSLVLGQIPPMERRAGIWLPKNDGITPLPGRSVWTKAGPDNIIGTRQRLGRRKASRGPDPAS